MTINKIRVSAALTCMSLFLLGFFNEAKAAITILSVGGQGWISQNIEQTIGPSTGFTSLTSGTGTRNKVNVTLYNPSTDKQWSAQFRAPTGQDLGLGMYEGVVKYNANPLSNPGLNVFGDGRGSATVSGYFEIKEIVFSGNNITKFAADGYQITDSNPNDYLRFSVRWNSDVPLTPLSSIVAVPEPSAIALLAPLVGVLAFRRKRK